VATGDLKVRINVRGLNAMRRKARAAPADKVFERMYRQWAVRYRRFTRREFLTASRGGGRWDPLAASTIRRRRHGGGAVNANGKIKRISGGGKRGVRAQRKALASGGGQVAILRDLGKLYDATDPVFSNAPGAWEKLVQNGIEVGFGGPAKHPNGSATIADIAAFHQFGNEPKMPAREILLDPDAQTMQGMEGDAERAMAALIRDSDIGGGRVG